MTVTDQPTTDAVDGERHDEQEAIRNAYHGKVLLKAEAVEALRAEARRDADAALREQVRAAFAAFRRRAVRSPEEGADSDDAWLAERINEAERAALATPAAPSPEDAECWFCKSRFPVRALIAGYDTFDEQRLACNACNERMSGNWRPRDTTPAPSPEDRLLARLDELAKLQPDWDSYGATPITPEAIATARLMLTERPAIVPTTKGGIAFEWPSSAEVNVEIEPDGTIPDPAFLQPAPSPEDAAQPQCAEPGCDFTVCAWVNERYWCKRHIPPTPSRPTP